MWRAPRPPSTIRTRPRYLPEAGRERQRIREEAMKKNLFVYRRSVSIAAVTFCAALTISTRVTAQEQAKQAERLKQYHYKLIVLGTLGGPQSYGDPGHGAANMNNRGTAVGVADTSAADPFYPNFNPLLSGQIGSNPFIYHAFTTTGATIVDLGGLPGDYNSVASFITKNGLVAGESLNGSFDPFTGWPAEDPVLWKDGQIFNL